MGVVVGGGRGDPAKIPSSQATVGFFLLPTGDVGLTSSCLLLSFPCPASSSRQTQVLAVKTILPEPPCFNFPFPPGPKTSAITLQPSSPSYQPSIGASRRGELLQTLGILDFLGREVSLLGYADDGACVWSTPKSDIKC